ncbi:MAG: helix-turn-helix domain-containing protein, partial [Pirellulaceae bacterium]
MAGKFIDLKEAAKMLGCTPEELVEMRSHGDISGYRDGSSWKFKIEEVERVMADKGGKSGTGSGLGSGVLENDDDFDEIIKSGLSSSRNLSGDKASDSVLITEQELGHSAEGTSSTIIGKGEKAAGPADSDLKLAEGLSGAGSDKLLEAPGSRLKSPDKADVLGGDLKIAGGSGTGDMPRAGSGTGEMPAKTGSGTGDMPKASGGVEMSDDLDLESSEELDLGEELEVAGSGKKKGSDVTLGAGDSGINLKPSDSGLNLEEEALDLGSGSAIESLELP